MMVEWTEGWVPSLLVSSVINCHSEWPLNISRLQFGMKDSQTADRDVECVSCLTSDCLTNTESVSSSQEFPPRLSNDVNYPLIQITAPSMLKWVRHFSAWHHLTYPSMQTLLKLARYEVRCVHYWVSVETPEASWLCKELRNFYAQHLTRVAQLHQDEFFWTSSNDTSALE